jgi:hypothetical protein
MAEAVGLAASIAGLLTFTASLVKAGHSFYYPFVEFIREVESIKYDVELLEKQLKALKPLIDKLVQHPLPHPTSLIIGMDSLDACTSTLNDIKKLYQQSAAVVGRPTRNMLKRFMWPMSRSEVHDIVRRLDGHKSSFTLVLTGYGM